MNKERVSTTLGRAELVPFFPTDASFYPIGLSANQISPFLTCAVTPSLSRRTKGTDVLSNGVELYRTPSFITHPIHPTITGTKPMTILGSIIRHSPTKRCLPSAASICPSPFSCSRALLSTTASMATHPVTYNRAFLDFVKERLDEKPDTSEYFHHCKQEPVREAAVLMVKHVKPSGCLYSRRGASDLLKPKFLNILLV